MSYINEALRKAQKDKKLPYAAYEPIVSASDKGIIKPRKWFPVAGIVILLFLALVIIIALPTAKKKIPIRENLNIADTQTAAPMEREPAAGKMPVENKKVSASAIKKVDKKTVVKKETADAKKLYAQALQKQQEGKLKEAKKLYKKVIKMDPHNAEAFNNLGVVYMKKKVNKWAIIRLNDALKVKYDYPDAHYNLACIYAQNNDFDKSISYLKNAIGFNPEVRKWAQNDNDLKVLADLPEFKKLLEKK